MDIILYPLTTKNGKAGRCKEEIGVSIPGDVDWGGHSGTQSGGIYTVSVYLLIQQAHSQVCISELKPHVGLYRDTYEEFVPVCFCVLEAIYVSITRGIAKSKMTMRYYTEIRSSGLDEHSNTVHNTNVALSYICGNRRSEAQGHSYKLQIHKIKAPTNETIYIKHGGGGNWGKGKRKGEMKKEERK